MPIAVMLATLTDRRDFGDDWLLERKFDGERCVARKDGGEVRLESRTGKDLTGTYPEVRAAVAAQRLDQLSAGRRGGRVRRRADVLQPAAAAPGGHEAVSERVAELPRRLLRLRPAGAGRRGSHRAASASSAARGSSEAIRPSAALQLSEAWRGDSERRFAEACRSGWEGLIAKRADAPYAAAARGTG